MKINVRVKKIGKLPIVIKYKDVKATKITTSFTEGVTMSFNELTRIIDGYEKIPNYQLYDKINEIIDVVNNKKQ